MYNQCVNAHSKRPPLSFVTNDNRRPCNLVLARTEFLGNLSRSLSVFVWTLWHYDAVSRWTPFQTSPIRRSPWIKIRTREDHSSHLIKTGKFRANPARVVLGSREGAESCWNMNWASELIDELFFFNDVASISSLEHLLWFWCPDGRISVQFAIVRNTRPDHYEPDFWKSSHTFWIIFEWYRVVLRAQRLFQDE